MSKEKKNIFSLVAGVALVVGLVVTSQITGSTGGPAVADATGEPSESPSPSESPTPTEEPTPSASPSESPEPEVCEIVISNVRVMYHQAGWDYINNNYAGWEWKIEVDWDFTFDPPHFVTLEYTMENTIGAEIENEVDIGWREGNDFERFESQWHYVSGITAFPYSGSATVKGWNPPPVPPPGQGPGSLGCSDTKSVSN